MWQYLSLVVRSEFVHHGAGYVAMAGGAQEEMLVRTVLSLFRPKAVPEEDVEQEDTSYCMKTMKESKLRREVDTKM